MFIILLMLTLVMCSNIEKIEMLKKEKEEED